MVLSAKSFPVLITESALVPTAKSIESSSAFRSIGSASLAFPQTVAIFLKAPLRRQCVKVGDVPFDLLPSRIKCLSRRVSSCLLRARKDRLSSLALRLIQIPLYRREGLYRGCVPVDPHSNFSNVLRLHVGEAPS